MRSVPRPDAPVISVDVPRPSRSGSAGPHWAFWGAAVVVICVARVLFPDGIVGQTLYLVITGGAAVAAYLGARRQPVGQRFPWGCVALGVALSAVGDTIYFVIYLVNGVLPDISVADAFFLATYGALAVGLSSLIVGRPHSRRVDIDGLIDIGSFAVLAVIVVMQFSVVRDIVADREAPMFTRLIWAAYPVFDAALLAVVVHAIVGRRLRGRGGVFLSCGVTLWLISDYLSLVFGYGPSIAPWLDVGWMLGAACLGLSVWPVGSVESPERSAANVARVTGARTLITLVPLLVPIAVVVWDFIRGNQPNPLPLAGATFALVLLAGVRSIRLVKARNLHEAALERSTRYLRGPRRELLGRGDRGRRRCTDLEQRTESDRHARTSRRDDDRCGRVRTAPPLLPRTSPAGV